MELKDIVEKRNKLSHDIMKLVREFETNAGCQITKLEVWHSFDLEKEEDVALVSATIEL